MKAAAAIFREDIQSCVSDNTMYPPQNVQLSLIDEDSNYIDEERADSSSVDQYMNIQQEEEEEEEEIEYDMTVEVEFEEYESD